MWLYISFPSGLAPWQVTTAATGEEPFALTQSVEGQWTWLARETGPLICSTPWRTLCLQSSAAKVQLQVETVMPTNRRGQ